MRIGKPYAQSWIALLALGVLAFAAACLPITEPPPLPADTLPEQLTDAEFWRMVAEFSEPGGQFGYENFISNEIKYQQVLPELTQRVRSGGVYLSEWPRSRTLLALPHWGRSWPSSSISGARICSSI